MAQIQKLKLALYSRQNNIVMWFLTVFILINIIYATNYYFAILFCLIIILLLRYSEHLFIKSQNTESGILVILSITILSVSFTQSIGQNAPIWLFHLINIFQVLFLVSNGKQKVFLIIINLAAGIITAYIQDQPMANILSRGAVLVLFSIYVLNTIQSLIKSSESLNQEVEDKIKLNAKLSETRTFQRSVLDSTNYAIMQLLPQTKMV